MRNLNQHIVARCSWNTVFDDKEKGRELQNAISNWSEHFMPRTLNDVFDTICTQYQSFKIKSLTIDLGAIQYENLKEQLTLKLQEVLQEQFREILNNPNKYKKNVQILKGEDVWFNVITHYLQQGIMPWNYTKRGENINQIFEIQFQENKEALIQAITAIAEKEYVRKRIAWQFKEANIHHIIASLERSNHNYIIEFSEEFTKLQTKETLVKAGIYDFKKNLWFWILNYLFVHRGTMFNKVEFVRSNIQQMANHFNMEYHELFALIEKAVQKLHEQSYIKNEFIHILEILSHKETENFQYEKATIAEQEKRWSLLLNYLQNPQQQKTSSEKEAFKELVNKLSQINKVRFQNLINKINNTTENWQFVSKDLQPELFGVLLKSISNEVADNVLLELKNLQKLQIQKHFQLNENWLFAISLKFIKKYKSQTFSRTKYLNFIFQEISTLKKKTKTSILEKLLNTDVQVYRKNDVNATIFHAIKDLYTNEILNQETKFTEEKLEIVLKALEKNLQEGGTTIITENYYEIIRNWIKKTPKQLWKSLKVQKNKNFILRILPELFNDEVLKTIVLDQVLSNQLAFIKDLEKSINKVLEKNTGANTVLHEFKTQLFFKGIKLLILEENKSKVSLVTTLFKEIVVQQSYKTSVIARESLLDVLLYFQKEHTDFSINQKKTLSNFIEEFTQTTTLEFLLKFIECTPNKQEEITEILEELVHRKEIHTVAFKKVEKKISNYLLKDADEVFKKTKNNFKNRLESKIDNSKVMHEIYWQCIADYKKHKGNQTKFKKLLEETIHYFLNDKIIQKEVFKIQFSSQIFTIKKLQNLLQKAIEKRELTLKIKTEEIAVQFAFFKLLESSPKAVREIIRTIKLTKNQIEYFEVLISFSQFLTLIIKDTSNNKLIALIRSIQVLYTIRKKVIGTSITKEKEFAFWECALNILQEKKESSLKKIVNDVFEEFYKIDTISVKFIIEKILYENIVLPPILKKILVNKNSTFRLIKEAEIISNVSEGSLKNQVIECLPLLSKTLLVENKIPSWFLHQNSITKIELLKLVLNEFPLTILAVLRKHSIAKKNLISNISFTEIVNVLSNLYPDKQTLLKSVEKFYKLIECNSISKSKVIKIREVLYEKVLSAWIKNNWKPLTTASIWKELIWEISIKNIIKENDFYKALDEVKLQLPNTLQVSYEATRSTKKKTMIKKTIKKENISETKTNTIFKKTKIMNERILIPNAGLVLLNSYFPILFERLKLVENKSFVTKEAQIQAVHYLQYVATGLTQTEEEFLVLNKLLCGLNFEEPVKDSLDVSTENRELINGMLQSAIMHWNAIGSTTVNGFRGNWFVRDGILRENEDRWELTIEKRPYDILLNKSPFSFSIIKFPWMPKALHVSWPF
ncbi:contractile injection system tape measure protein [Tenacibaculum sp. ZS6-P6]|uniref:contractile injection system tape measure protein n=1 Tax=Tenacibaculum sp. ZS6-P6 TaxID=3447503 RepID=UPI003F9BA827